MRVYSDKANEAIARFSLKSSTVLNFKGDKFKEKHLRDFPNWELKLWWV